ncbi:hypothetical protein PGT21_032668 [Puccinia graminis f. sp. tritici]|uniref:Uncharacterized protein n=1 Tax=Puccinia graminis f. sp. tritici TaxID=56615 RepID=A0A5B0R435_PUCGR|nr:hypothetical protein PGT21_032668 [Puccinia graminis f. sp. tritici]
MPLANILITLQGCFGDLRHDPTRPKKAAWVRTALPSGPGLGHLKRSIWSDLRFSSPSGKETCLYSNLLILHRLCGGVVQLQIGSADFAVKIVFLIWHL